MKKYKQIIYAILFVIILILLGVVLVVILRNRDNSDSINNSVTVGKNLNMETQTEQVLFSRGSVAFSMELPDSWIFERNVVDNPNSERIILFSANSQSYTPDFVATDREDGLYPPVQLLVRFFNDAGFDLSAWYSKHKSELAIGYIEDQYEILEQDLTIKELPAKSFQIRTSATGSSDIGDTFYDRYVFFKNENRIFELHIYGKPVLIDRLSLDLDTIINSFLFKDPSNFSETTSVN